MILYCNKKSQDDKLKELEKLHDSVKNDVDLNDLIKRIREAIIYPKDIKNIPAQQWRDGLLGPLRRINLIQSNNFSLISENLSQNYKDVAEDDLEYIKISSFFYEAKYLIDVFQKNFSFLKVNKKLIEEITTLRNIFAHAYNKKFQGKKYFVRVKFKLSKLRDIERKLDVLEVFDLKTSEMIQNIYFSKKYIFSEIKKLTEELINILNSPKI